MAVDPREAEDQSMIPKDEQKDEQKSFGDRLDYTKPEYRDLWCAIIYLIHLIVMIAITAFLIPQAMDSNSNSSNNNNTNETEESEEIDLTGAITVVISCAILGLLLGFCWLEALKRWALQIIKIMIYLNILLWVVLIIVGIATGQFVLAIVAVFMVLFWALYTWCMWNRIKFSSVLLALSSRIISSFPGTVCVTITMILFTLIWIIIWLLCVASYVQSTETTDETTGETGEESSPNYNANAFVIFLLFISLYWVIQVNSNVSHTTSCGVAASWYFTPPDQEISGTGPAFKRSMTTSFGSICFGSLIVAVLQAIRAMIEIAEGRKEGNACVLCLIKCCVVCIQRCIEWFNKYAFAHCAIYGTSFMTSAGNTFELLSSRGILALINEDLTGMALFAGALISAVLCGLIGAGIAFSFYGSDNGDMIIALGVYGAICGLVLTLLVLSTVQSAIICLFVCFAEEPAVLYQNRREEFKELADIKPEFQTVYESWGMKSV
eukprot:832439_1